MTGVSGGATMLGAIGFVGRYGLKPFGWYRIFAGAAIIAVLLAR